MAPADLPPELEDAIRHMTMNFLRAWVVIPPSLWGAHRHRPLL